MRVGGVRHGRKADPAAPRRRERILHAAAGMRLHDSVVPERLPPTTAYLPVRVGLAIIAVCAAGFLALLVLLRAGALSRLDAGILLAMADAGSHAVDGAALEITSLGSAWVVWLIALVVGVMVHRMGHTSSTALLWGTIAGGALLNSGLKVLFGRQRPEIFEWRTPYAGELAFPSGHSMTAMVAYASLSLVLVRVLRPGPALAFAIGACALAVLLVGVTRVYLGVHYPSDVLGGYLAGLGWAVGCTLLVQRWEDGRRGRGDAG